MRRITWSYRTDDTPIDGHFAVATELEASGTVYSLYKIRQSDGNISLAGKIGQGSLEDMLARCDDFRYVDEESIADFVFWFGIKKNRLNVDLNDETRSCIRNRFSNYTPKERTELFDEWVKETNEGVSKAHKDNATKNEQVPKGRRVVDDINKCLMFLKSISPDLLNNAYSFQSMNDYGDIEVGTGYTIDHDDHITPVDLLVHYTDKHHWSIQSIPEE